MILKPLFTNLLIKPVEETEETIITEPNPNDPIRGEVIEVGNGEIKGDRYVTMEVQPHSIIHFYKQDARRIPTIDGDWYVLNQEDVLVVEKN